MGSPFTTTAGTATIERAASEAAQNYLRDLMLEKAVKSGHDAAEASVNINGWIARHPGKSEVSANIDRLKAEGFTGRIRSAAGSAAPADLPSAEIVPAGRYAIETEDGATNGLAFYKVDRPEEGKWAGRVFVKLMVSDEEQRMSWAATKSILAKIAEVGAAEASARYGHEIGECGVCGRTLTNDESRERGIGPICAAKNSW
ncbi:hypothetical protein SEA_PENGUINLOVER67_48 [Mycobacterium phage PenguinLover67]|nr:hypothetical protein SEA_PENGUINLOVER67_48 [Mycobacterium phage PenguinLover67]